MKKFLHLGLAILFTSSMAWGALTPIGGGLPPQTGNAGKFLTTDGTAASWATVSGGSGMDVHMSNASATAFPVDLLPAITDTTNVGSGSKTLNAVFSNQYQFFNAGDQKGYMYFDSGLATLFLVSQGHPIEFLSNGGGISYISQGDQTFDAGGSAEFNFSGANHVNILGHIPLRLYDNASNYVDFSSPGTIPSSYTFILPTNAGSSGQVLSTNGSGVTSWISVSGGSGANIQLSNLDFGNVAINTDLIWGAGTAGLLKTHDNTGLGGTPTLTIKTGDDIGGPTGAILVASGDGDGSSGAATFGSGSGGNASGLTTVSSGPAGGQPSGNTLITTGVGGNGFGTSGNVILSPNANAAIRGKIKFQEGSEGTSGQFWTSFTADGAGHWADIVAFAGGGFTSHLSSSGTTPSPGACGSSPSVSGNDISGTVTVGTGGIATSCTINFATAYASAPHCFVNNQTTIVAVQAVPSTTALVMNSTLAFSAGAVLDYYCIASQ